MQQNDAKTKDVICRNTASSRAARVSSVCRAAGDTAAVQEGATQSECEHRSTNRCNNPHRTRRTLRGQARDGSVHGSYERNMVPTISEHSPRTPMPFLVREMRSEELYERLHRTQNMSIEELMV